MEKYRDQSANLVSKMGGLVIDIVVGSLLRMIRNAWRRRASRDWLPITGRVSSCSMEKPGYGGDYVEIKYRYKFEGERYTGTYTEPFLLGFDKEYIARFTEDAEIRVRVNPADPSKSVLAEA
jgi:hypothetical protein